jgi:hypothetical protein
MSSIGVEVAFAAPVICSLEILRVDSGIDCEFRTVSRYEEA